MGGWVDAQMVDVGVCKGGSGGVWGWMGGQMNGWGWVEVGR